MISKILVPLDGSMLAERAIPGAAALAQAAGAPLVLMHAWSPHAAPGQPDYDVAAVADRLRADGLKVQIVVERFTTEDVSTLICRVSYEQGADLIAMSTHGRGGLGRWLFGSVTDQTLRRSDVPVLIVPPGVDVVRASACPTRILVPLDGSLLSQEALAPANALAGLVGADLLLVRVVGLGYDAFLGGFPTPNFDPDAELAAARAYLDAMAAPLRERGHAVSVHVNIGNPSTTLPEVGRALKADLVVMATHGHGGLARLVMGSVATGMIREASTPILLIRPSAMRSSTEEDGAATEEATSHPTADRELQATR